jgi:enamine deaminase RidA (YjgF/YER057c/UK114 family)
MTAVASAEASFTTGSLSAAADRRSTSASTMVQVASLSHRDYMIEVEALAVV